MNQNEMIAEIERLKAQNAQLQAKVDSKLTKPTLKVSDKGAVSVYGLMRFPVTLYGEQWGRLLDMSDEIKAFIKANASKLSVKAPK